MRERLGLSELYASLILLIIVSSMGVVVYSYTVETTMSYEQHIIEEETRESKRILERVTISSVLDAGIDNNINITVYNYGQFDTSIVEVYVNNMIVNNYNNGQSEKIDSLGLKKISFESPVPLIIDEQYTIIVVSQRGITDTYIWKR
jgi:hypothetical protein